LHGPDIGLILIGLAGTVGSGLLLGASPTLGLPNRSLTVIDDTGSWTYRRLLDKGRPTTWTFSTDRLR
jgi:hypothetical protein